MFRLSLILVLLCTGSVATAGTQLGVEGPRFTLNGEPTFLLGISYYGGLGAPRQFIEQDLDDMQRLGFNWIRVWAMWEAFESPVSAVDQAGEPRQPYFDHLKWLIAECDRRGMIVDVTLSRSDGVLGVGRLPTFDAHWRAIQLLATQFKPFRNWYLDLANENDTAHKKRSGESVSISELRKLRDRLKQLDPDRLVTCSTTGEFDEQELRDYVLRAGMDFFSPHRPRLADSPRQTAAVTRRCLAAMNDFGRVAPVHYQEPFRRSVRPDRWDPTAGDFLMDLNQAIEGGAAGWCFHNGETREHPEGNPRRSFDMREMRLFEQLDHEELKVVQAAGRLLSDAPGGRTPSRRLAATGPLRVHPDNPRYFTDGSGRAIYLTGSHTWASLQDTLPVEGEQRPFDYDAYLDFLEEHNHNFFRLWAWESTLWVARDSKHALITPLPFVRTGPGEALDGQPQFDVTQFNQAYFDRLRRRVETAQERGCYVAVMLFQGFSVARKSPERQDTPWEGHPLNKGNNRNGINGDADGDGEGYEVHTLSNPAVTRVQEAYVRKVIDAVNDLDNVIYEISNESHGDSTQWQYHFIRFIHEYERSKPKQHPVWMSYQWDGIAGAGRNEDLWKSPAEALSPAHDDNRRGARPYRTDPPATNAGKVILCDTDHIWGVGGDVAWVWKCMDARTATDLHGTLQELAHEPGRERSNPNGIPSAARWATA